MRSQDLARLIFSLLFLLGAIANGFLLITQPELYRGFADLALVGLYRQVWSGFVFPHIHLLVGMVIVFELVLAVLLLAKGLAVRIGLVTAAAFMLFLFPFWWSGGGLLNLAFAVVLFHLTRSSYPVSLPRLKGRTESLQATAPAPSVLTEP
jgi:hypothetical protein